VKNNIIVYTKDNCPFCTKAKLLLQSKGETFSEVKLGIDITREEFMEVFPNVKTVPFIIINGNHVGGYDKLEEWTIENGKQFLAD
jgi:glutaredoxin 3